MFEKYNINDLYLASISVMYPDKSNWDTDIGGVFMSGFAGYGYLTVIKKENEKYIDLQDATIKITTERNPKVKSYTINHMEPLSKYYTQEGKKKDTLTKRQGLKVGKKYYEQVNTNYLKKIEERQKIKSL